MDSCGRGDSNQHGRIVILPASFTGSPRYMSSHFQDAMALVRQFGKPDLFITMTMDIHCPEVTGQLREGQTPYDRPDLLTRVFHGKRRS